MRTTEPVVADDNAAEQTVREQPVERPAVVATAEVAEEDPTQDKAGTSTLTRGDETTGTPPLSSVLEEEDKVSSPPPAIVNRTGPDRRSLHRSGSLKRPPVQLNQ